MLRHVHLTLILLGVIGTLQTFALVFMLTKGGPNHATEMLPTYIFLKAFTSCKAWAMPRRWRLCCC